MNGWMLFLVTLFALVPMGLMVFLGLKRQFEREVFGRIYVCPRPWSLVTRDAKVQLAFERFRLRAFGLLVFLVILFGVLVFLVF